MANAINSLSYNSNTYVLTLPYGVCSTAADVAAKVVSVDNFSLETGAVVIVKFSNANSASSPTLNVNSTGAKPIMRYGTTAASTSNTTSGWAAGSVQMFIFDGTNWIRDYWYNTTYKFDTLSSSGNTLTVKVLGTEKTTTLVNSVSNTWTAGTTSGPTIKTTVNGITGSGTAIPAASGSASGVVTTSAQTFAGEKTFSSKISLSGTAYSTAQIYFARQDPSYIRTNSSGYLCFVTDGKSESTANSDLIIKNACV